KTDPDEAIVQPAGSRVMVERSAGRLTMVVPPVGVRKGGKGMFGFAIVWCLFMVAFTAGWGYLSAHKHDPVPLPVWLVTAGLWAIGIGMLAGAINMGQRRAILVIENGQLKVAQIGLFGTKKWAWRREDVSAIRADASGMAVNDCPILELQIHPTSGKKI